jgi:mono/diheme cytochrome c family protein
MLMGGDNMARGIFDVISKGRNQMPAFAGQMTNEQIWLMVEYLRSF